MKNAFSMGTTCLTAMLLSQASLAQTVSAPKPVASNATNAPTIRADEPSIDPDKIGGAAKERSAVTPSLEKPAAESIANQGTAAKKAKMKGAARAHHGAAPDPAAMPAPAQQQTH